MNWHLALGVIGGIIALFAIIPYIKDILKKTTRPNTVSWSIWAFLLLISILAQLNAGASWSIILLVGDFIGTSTIVVLCLIGYGYGKYSWLEWTCLTLAILAIISWQTTRQPVLAIAFAIIADAMAAIPTLVKTYRDPWSEHPTMWLIVALGALLSILSTTIFNLPNLLFPAYLLAVNGTTGILALVGRSLKEKPAA
jgi:uncharacterized membrane protein YoaK (UPF0700 family)